MELLVFALFGALALISAIVVVTHRNPVYSVMSLVVTLLSIAVLFVQLGAPLLAVLLVLVYTGAILVLFLFVIMLLNVGREEPGGGAGKAQKIGAALAALAFGAVLLGLFWGTWADFRSAALEPAYTELKPLAAELLSTYLLPFEIVGVLLLAAVIAATVLARRAEPGEGGS